MGKLTYQSGFKPTIDPFNGSDARSEIDRCQTIDPSVTLPQDGIRQLGSDGVSAWIKGIMDAKVTMKQFEYGSMEFYRRLANKSDATTAITLPDFDASAFDIPCYLTNTSGAFYATLLLPELRLSGFSVAISNAKALVERNFSFEGNECVIFQGNNKYFIKKTETVNSGELSSTTWTVVLSDPTPVADPDTSDYIYRVVRVRGSDTEEISTFTYDSGTHTLTVTDAALADVYKIYYTAGSYIGGQSPFTANIVDAYGVRASYCKLFIGTSTQLHEVTSATLDVTITRDDPIGIGSIKPIERGVSDREVKVTLGQLANSDLTMEEILRGETSGYGKIDYDQLDQDLTFIIAVYDNANFDNLLIGYKATTMMVADAKPGTGNVKANETQSFTLHGTNLTITTSQATLGI